MVVNFQKTDYIVYWTDYRGDDQDYLIKDECQNITSLSCDLTAETPSVYDVYYRAKVMVNGTCYDITTFFKPLRDSKTLHTHYFLLYFITDVFSYDIHLLL